MTLLTFMVANKPMTLNYGIYIAKAINNWRVFSMMHHIFIQALS